MKNSALHEFTDRLLQKRRITFGDVKRLQRNILPDGISSREEVELLLGVERVAVKADRAWPNYLVPAVVEYVVWTERPTGAVDEGAASWIADLLRAEPRSRTSACILREIAAEAQTSALCDAGDDQDRSPAPVDVSHPTEALVSA